MKKGILALFTAAFIWGFCYVGQTKGMEAMGPLSFSAVRLTLGGFSMIPLVLIMDKLSKDNKDKVKEYRTALYAALTCCPSILAVILLQQYALLYTSVSKCAFITAFYIFIVPLFSLFLGEKVSKRIWIAVILSLAGLYLITGTSGFDNINIGDVLSLFAAIAFATYIKLLEEKASKVDGVKLSMFQFLLCGLLCFIFAPMFEPGQITWENYLAGLWAIAFTGIVSCTLGYTLQIIGQARVDANKATLILSSETVFSLFSGMIFLHEILLPIEYIGCALMTVAIVISVIPEKSTSQLTK